MYNPKVIARPETEKIINLYNSQYVRPMGGSRGGGGVSGPGPHLENHKLLYASLEILVRIPLEKRLDPWVQLLPEADPYCPL